MPKRPTPAHERVLARIESASDGCWVFTGAVTMATGDRPGGYGKVWKDGKTALAHRVVYEALVGPIPAGMQTDHLCRVKRCVNPEHLELVTGAENMRRTRKRFCNYGHDLDLHARQMGNTRRCWQCHLRIAKESRLRRAGQ